MATRKERTVSSNDGFTSHDDDDDDAGGGDGGGDNDDDEEEEEVLGSHDDGFPRYQARGSPPAQRTAGKEQTTILQSLVTT